MSAENAISAGLTAIGFLLTAVLALIQGPGIEHLSDIRDVQWLTAFIGAGISFLGSYHTVKMRQFTSDKILNTPSNYVRVSDIPTLDMSQKVGQG